MSRKTRLILLLIASIYLISVSIRLFFPAAEKDHFNQQSDIIDWNGASVEFNYLTYGEQNAHSMIILFPDPFSGENDLDPFAYRLSPNWQVIIPLYPTHSVEGDLISHSAASRANLVSKWLKKKNSGKLHIAGHGFGNSVAIEFLNSEVESEILSYTMLSALGVQEFHFLGYYPLNKPIYSLLYPVGFMIEYGLPLASWHELSTINMETVRVMNRLDQRSYRDILESLAMPVLIMHGENDTHVSVQTAREHYRIIPQSELALFDGGHESIVEYTEEWVERYASFLNASEIQEAITKDEALPERIEFADKEFEFGNVPPVYGMGLIIILVLLSFITLMSEDLGCIGGGLLVAGGVIPLWIAFLTIFLGITIADVGIYWMGRKLGRPVIYKAPIRWFISKRDIERSAYMFQTNGFKIVFASRFIPGSRFPIYFTAGLLKTNFNFFLLYFLIAITIWTPLLLWITILAGQQMLVYLQIYQEYAIYIFFALIIGLYLLFKVVMPLATKKGRKEFAVRMIRLKQRFFEE